MEYHLDHRVVLDQEPEFKNLYKWSLQEVDADGKKTNRDQIPWQWDLYFTATELALSDTIRVGHDYQFETDDTKLVTRTHQFIRAKLEPGRGQENTYRRPSYSMFGSTRTISNFELTIEKVENADAQPMCRAWGGVSYTTEFDFRDETTQDTVVFHLCVPAAAFSEYARKIEADAIDEAILRLGGVDGFYSDWSPSISTNDIKVLTDDKEHKVEMPTECEIDPPRLGRVAQAELYLRRIDKLGGIPTEPDDEWSGEPSLEEGVATAVVGPHDRNAATDARVVALLASLRLAAWVIAGLLLVLLLK